MGIYNMLYLFFLYSFTGWCLEIVAAAVKRKKFVNRGLLNGPMCMVYGCAACIITLNTEELVGNYGFLFLFSVILGTVVEWVAGHLLEKTGTGRWWDYSQNLWNLDGYICFKYSVFWGILGTLGVEFVNPLFYKFIAWIPGLFGLIFLCVLSGFFIVDLLGSLGIVLGSSKNQDNIKTINNQLSALAYKIGMALHHHVKSRLKKAYPTIEEKQKVKQKAQVFAQGCSFYKLAMLFGIGAFLGDIVETIFCRVTAGVWMSRSSVVWGNFSIVWGLAFAMATAFLYQYRKKSDRFIFIIGTMLGGAYEYICSVFTEKVFGTVFWDYSKIPFNLGGRINLLYCFFWGFAAVIWLKGLYPFMSKWIEKIPMAAGKIITWAFLLFMCIDITASCMALNRYDSRKRGQMASSSWEQWMDVHYDNVRMKQIYPNALSVNN